MIKAVLYDLDCFNRDDREAAANIEISDGNLFSRVYRDRLVHNLKQTPCYSGVIPALDELRKHHIPLAIATGRLASEIPELLEAAGLAGRFAQIVTQEQVAAPKPDPALYLRASKLVGAAPAECLIVGDAAVDILAARRMGAPCALFYPPEHSDYYRLEDLEALQPTFICTHREVVSMVLSSRPA